MTLRFVIAALFMLPAGCRQDAPPLPRQAAAEPTANPQPQPRAQSPAGSTAATDALAEPLGPADVVRRVNELRRAGRLKELASWVAENQRAAVIELIRAVDQLLLDNRVLLERIKASGATATATLFDRPGAADIIDVFSHDVEVVSEQVHGDSAEVTIRVGQRLPFSVVRLERRGGRWIIQPDPPIPGLAGEIRNLGKALRRVAQAVGRQQMTAEEIEKEIEFWQTPVLKKIDKLLGQARPGSTANPSEPAKTG